MWGECTLVKIALMLCIEMFVFFSQFKCENLTAQTSVNLLGFMQLDVPHV